MRTLRLTDGRSYPPKVILRLSGRHGVKRKTVHAKAIGHRALGGKREGGLRFPPGVKMGLAILLSFPPLGLSSVFTL